MPARVTAAVLVPRLEEAARQAAALHGTPASLPGQYELQALRGALSTQLSFDPLDPAYVHYKTRLGYPSRIGTLTGQSLAALKRVRVVAVRVG